MTWEEIKKTVFGEKKEDGRFFEYEMSNKLVKRLEKVEKNQEQEEDFFGGFILDTYKKQYPICMKIVEKFRKDTGIDVKISFQRYGCGACIFVNFYRGFEIKVGQKVSPVICSYYYSSAWEWGSGRWGNNYLENPYFEKAEPIVEAIAYLDNYGKVTKVTTKTGESINTKDNAMVLISVNGVNMGWIAPYNLLSTK